MLFSGVFKWLYILHFRKNLVDFCFADRSFSNVDNVIKSFRMGGLMYFFYKIFWFGNSDTAENYLKVSVITNDLVKSI